MTNQQNADAALQRWQELRRAGLTPQERLEVLMTDFWQVPVELDIAFQDQLNAVQREMEHA